MMNDNHDPLLQNGGNVSMAVDRICDSLMVLCQKVRVLEQKMERLERLEVRVERLEARQEINSNSNGLVARSDANSSTTTKDNFDQIEYEKRSVKKWLLLLELGVTLFTSIGLGYYQGGFAVVYLFVFSYIFSLGHPLKKININDPEHRENLQNLELINQFIKVGRVIMKLIMAFMLLREENLWTPKKFLVLILKKYYFNDHLE
ncbi:hypothetical protein BN7_2679 [Wickerhamomyces ciferrii]|uniref:Uncharacterized protein n=1 Tax=Wickerhamomyces ciferrii (strain ATCC 14091 / BCRC 22168 / CBS 111 / JCM 3599 / NBRC 0793 / NRRL Y-1031 F-60-10) TaxID=1206466 RepID=K0KLN9_WICCF|nr:uncharacterized protein BN7_2679 [Wickerhamomyces ciferrii]CCH43132.1 hypothetical protein BN7_2679 [Wickerhamomyces ciferrii]